MSRRLIALLLGLAAAIALLSPAVALAAGAPDPYEPSTIEAQPVGTTRMLSVRYDGEQTMRNSTHPVPSADGSAVAFSSRARLVETWSRVRSQVYLRDVESRTTTLVSRTPDGKGGNGPTGWPSISADGTRVVYPSTADNLVDGDTNGLSDVFLYDAATETTTMVSQAPDGRPGNGSSDVPVISADGSHVVYRSTAKNLGPGGTDWGGIFVYDLETGTTKWINRTAGGGEPNYYSYRAWISGDGSRVSYRSGASNLVADDTNGRDDIFLWDRAARTTTLLSRTPDGKSGNADSVDGMISADGTRVAFFSWATNLVPDDGNNEADVFLYDVAAGTNTLVSRGRSGQAADGGSSYPTISGDGTLIAYTSWASDLVRDDDYLGDDVFVYDSTSDSTVMISRSRNGSSANGRSDRAAISIDGTRVAFESAADNLVVGDTDADYRPYDVFLNRLS